MVNVYSSKLRFFGYFNMYCNIIAHNWDSVCTIYCNNAPKGCLLQFVHTKAITASTQFSES